MKKAINIFRLNHWRYRNSWMDYAQDGMEDEERIKGKDKKYLNKKRRSSMKKIDEED